MNSKNQIAALFMILLVVFIPFYVSDAHAATLDVQKISGLDGVDGFIRTTDMVSIQAVASISDEEDVESGKLRVYVDDFPAYNLFDSCERVSEASSSFACSYTRAVYGIRGSHIYRIDLHTGATQYDDFATPAASESREVIADVVGARIVSIEAVPERTTTGQVTISYTAEDYGIDETDKEKCSGVERIEFYEGDYSGELIKVDYPSMYLCELSSDFSYNAVTDTDAKITICAMAYDRLNQTTIESRCADFFVDTSAPEPDWASLRIVRAGTDEVIDFIGKDTVLADISLVIDAEDLVVESVKADLSNIAGLMFADADFTGHTADDSRHTFGWRNVPIGTITACLIDVYAEDVIGNSATTTVPCGVKTDVKGPAVSGLLTAAMKEDIFYLGIKSIIAARITEEGIGLNNNDIFLDLTNINGQSRVRPNNCTRIKGSEWECLWYDVEPNVDDGVYPVVVYKESRDDLGNIMDDKYEQDFGVDTTSPEINQDVLLNVIPGVTAIPYQNITIAGDTLEFVLEVSDAWSATANFSAIGGGDEVLPESCWRENESTYCLWETPVLASGPYDADVSFNFMDFAGNYNTITKDVFVSGTLNMTNPNYWEHTVTCSPPYIDREIASLINQPVFCHISLSPINNPHAQMMSFTMEEYPARCYALDDENITITDYVQNIILINNHPGSTDPYMQLTLQVGEFWLDEFDFACEFDIFTEIDDLYTLYPEVENVSSKLEFYDLPSGHVGDQYEDDIEDAEDAIAWMDDWLTEVMLFMEYAEKACQIYAGLNAVLGALAVISATLGITAAVTKGTAWGASIEAVWLGSCQANDKAVKSTLALKIDIFDQLCSFMNCKWSQPAGDSAFNSIRGGVAAQSTAIQEALTAGFDVKESIIWSAATLCLPGILYNFNKYRQVYCQYLVCMIQDVPTGVPVYICESIRGFLLCKFLWGQILNLLPFLQMWSNLIEGFIEAISDPFSAAAYLLSLAGGCGAMCAPGTESASVLCVTLGAISMIGDAINEIMLMLEDDYWSVGGDDDWCSQYEDLEDDDNGDNGNNTGD